MLRSTLRASGMSGISSAVTLLFYDSCSVYRVIIFQQRVAVTYVSSNLITERGIIFFGD